MGICLDSWKADYSYMEYLLALRLHQKAPAVSRRKYEAIAAVCNTYSVLNRHSPAD